MKLKGIWKDNEFVKYWAGQTFSVFGSNVATFLMPLTAIYVLEASALQMGILQAMSGIPFLLFSLIVGVLVDRVRRLRMMIIVDFGRAILIGIIPLLYVLDVLNIYHLYVLALGVGFMSVLFETAYQAYLPMLVGKDKLVDANSSLQFSQSLAQISGPGLAGFLIGIFAAPLTLIMNALTFFASAISLARIRFSEPKRSLSLGKISLEDVTEGLKIILKHAVLRPLTLGMGCINMFFNLFLAVYYLYLSEKLGLSSGMMGLVLSIGALGATTAVLVTKRLSLKFSPGQIVILAEALFALGAWLVPLAGGHPIVRLIGVFVAAICAFFGGAAANIMAITIYQKVTPDHLLGRVSASSKFFLGGLMPIGSLLGGIVGELLGLRLTLFVGAMGISAMVVWLLLSRVRTASEGDLENKYSISSNHAV